jgi:hypothetical protein
MHRYNFVEFLARFNDEPEELPFFKTAAELPSPHTAGPWIAGGAIRRTLSGMPLESDVDYFFASVEQKDAFVADVEARGGWIISDKEHAVTLGLKVEHATVILQAVTMAYYASIEAVLDSFDFTITQFGYDGTDMVCGEFSLWDLARKRLALHKLTFGVSTVRRLIKYTRQGFTACGGVLASILEATVADPQTIHRDVTYVD